VIRFVVFTRQQLCCPTAATLAVSSPSKVGQFSSEYALCPTRPGPDPLLVLLWEVGLLPHPCSQSLCFSQPLLCASLALLGGWLATPHRLSAFVAFPAFVHGEFRTENLGPCPTSILSGRFRVLPLPSMLVLDYNSLIMLFNFGGKWRVQFVQWLHWIMFMGLGRRVMRGACCSPVHSADSYKQLWNCLMGRNGMPLFSAWHGVRRLYMGQGSRMLQSLILIDALFSACWEKKERNSEGAFFPKAGHTLLAVPHGFLLAVRCN
jgi:hypothetical protein